MDVKTLEKELSDLAKEEFKQYKIFSMRPKNEMEASDQALAEAKWRAVLVKKQVATLRLTELLSRS